MAQNIRPVRTCVCVCVCVCVSYILDGFSEENVGIEGLGGEVHIFRVKFQIKLDKFYIAFVEKKG